MISIKLNEPSKSYAPGDMIAGSVTWAKLLRETDRLEIRLIWYTQGKADRDVGIILSNVREAPGEAGEQEFAFQTPSRPFSFSGKLISLVWAIEVVEFPSTDGIREMIVVSRNREEIILEKSFPDHLDKAFFRLK